MTRPQVLPNGMAHTEWTAAAVDHLGLDPNAMLHIAVTLFGYVRGSAMSLEMQVDAEQETGLTDEQWMVSQSASMDRILESGRYPTLRAMFGAPGVVLDVDSLFEFGLQSLLDGFATTIEPRDPTSS